MVTTSLSLRPILALLLCWLQVQTTMASIEVICTGFPRTGTESLMEALEVLGYKTYFTKKLFVESYGAKHFENWKYLIDTDCQSENAKELLKDMLEVDAQATAVSYIGGLNCLEPLVELYPDAKVIHTQRESIDRWIESILGAPCNLFFMVELAGKLFQTPKSAYAFFNSFVNKKWFGQPTGTFPPSLESCNVNRDALKEQYTKHNANIHTRVPPERFLYFAKPEWESLAKFLGKELPPPSTKYPHSNTRKQFQQEVTFILAGTVVLIVVGVFLVITTVLRMRRRKPKKD